MKTKYNWLSGAILMVVMLTCSASYAATSPGSNSLDLIDYIAATFTADTGQDVATAASAPNCAGCPGGATTGIDSIPVKVKVVNRTVQYAYLETVPAFKAVLCSDGGDTDSVEPVFHIPIAI